jgi:xanthine dehydrogenase accessory protein XdhC
MNGLAATLRTWLARGDAAVLVTVAATRGSTPREAGTRMLVGSTATCGTVGGGRLELEAVNAARALIASGEATATMDVPLGAAIGQCCGGHVALLLERAGRDLAERLAQLEVKERAAAPAVYLFGAGHTGKAIARALALLPLRVTWIDSRAEEFPDAMPGSVERVIASRPADLVAEAAPGASYLVLTHNHALDFELAEAVLVRGDFRYLGLIGSTTKRRRFERWYVARGHEAADPARLTCPIGAGPVRDKRPEVIAALVAAELVVATAGRQETAAPDQAIPVASFTHRRGLRAMPKSG